MRLTIVFKTSETGKEYKNDLRAIGIDFSILNRVMCLHVLDVECDGMTYLVTTINGSFEVFCCDVSFTQMSDN